jgi:hypothetical protein
MLSKIRTAPVRSPGPGVIPDRITGPISNESPTAADRDRAPEQASAAPGHSDPEGGSVATERDERRHQRAVARKAVAPEGREAIAREGNGRGRGAKSGERLHQSGSQASGPSRRGRLVVGETVSVGLIGIIVVGLIAGAILGAVGASGWVIGLLVATLTVILSTVLRRFPHQR